MTLFEYLAIAFSLVLSSAAMRIVGGLSSATAAETRYWTHVGSLGIALWSIAVMFWGVWSYRDADWNLPRFLGLIAQLSVVYFGATALVPEVPSAVSSWRDHYYAVRFRYYVAVAVIGCLVAVNTTLLAGMPAGHPARLAQLSLVVFGITGASSRSPRVHGALVLAGVISAAALTFTVMFAPRSLAD